MSIFRTIQIYIISQNQDEVAKNASQKLFHESMQIYYENCNVYRTNNQIIY